MDATVKRLLLVLCGLGMVSGAAAVVAVAAAIIAPRVATPERPAASLVFAIALFAVCLWGSLRLLRRRAGPAAAGDSGAKGHDDGGPTAG